MYARGIFRSRREISSSRYEFSCFLCNTHGSVRRGSNEAPLRPCLLITGRTVKWNKIGENERAERDWSNRAGSGQKSPRNDQSPCFPPPHPFPLFFSFLFFFFSTLLYYFRFTLYLFVSFLVFAYAKRIHEVESLFFLFVFFFFLDRFSFLSLSLVYSRLID